jgi:hypothetical protein
VQTDYEASCSGRLHVDVEMRDVGELKAEGVVRAIYRRAAGSGVCPNLEGSGIDAVRGRMETLPFVVDGLATRGASQVETTSPRSRPTASRRRSVSLWELTKVMLELSLWMCVIGNDEPIVDDLMVARADVRQF